MGARRFIVIVGLAAVHTAGLGMAGPGTAGFGAVHAAPEPDAGATAPDARFDHLPLDVRPVVPGPDAGPATAAGAPGSAASPAIGPTAGAQVALTNADAWHAAGITGRGVKVGVIDFFDVSLFWNRREHGPEPVPGVTARCIDAGADCSGTYFDGRDDGGDGHGVAVVEVIKDMAPDAQIFIGTASTAADYRRLVDWFARSGVTVINRSLGSRYDGPGDGRGVLDEVAEHAVALGITWVNSGGNNGSDRYYRQPVRLVGDRVAFGPEGGATALPFVGCVALGGVRWADDWDVAPADRSDYDVYLWDSVDGDPSAGRIVASSEGDQRAGDVPIELFSTVHCPSASDRTLYLEVRWRGGDPAGDVLEILDYGHGIAAFTQAAYSAATPIADSREAGVLAVGAVDPPGGGTIGSYSSQGPTNDGRLAPDVSAPSGFASTVYRSGFSGTSAAAPVVAGGAALLLDARLAVDPASLGHLVRHLSTDRGRKGPDDVFGSGEFVLPAPPSELAPTPSRFVALEAPRRVLDTRATGRPVGPRSLAGRVEPGAILDLPLGDVVRDDTTAVAVNITAVGIDRPSFTQALPTLAAPIGGYSNLNIDGAAQTRANFAIVPVSPNGSISLYTTGGGHLVVDLLGSFRAAPDAVGPGRFVSLDDAERVLDTRRDAPVAPLPSGRVRGVPWPAGLAHDEIDALVVTVTGTGASGPGWVQAYPADRPDVIATTSTINVDVGTTVANTAIVPVGSTGIAVTGVVDGEGSVDVVVDVVGYITSSIAGESESGRYVAVRPGRAFDSRSGPGELTAGDAVVIDADAAPGSAIPASASGVVWNFAPIAVRQPGFGLAWAPESPQPDISSFNFSAPGEVRAAAVVTAVDDAEALVLLSDGTTSGTRIGELIADVFGYFT